MASSLSNLIDSLADGIHNHDVNKFFSMLKDFEIKNLGEYYDLYVKNNKLLLEDASENFTNVCLGKEPYPLAFFLHQD